MNAPRLLVVDDDLRLRDLLERYLGEQGFAVRGCGSVAAMRRELDGRHVDLVVLDLMLPDGNGLDACRALRADGFELPVIMLTAKGDDVDRIVGLELGADDYLPKPCNPRELVARIRAVLRRRAPRVIGAPETGAAALRFGPFLLDRAARSLQRGAQRIALTGGEYAVLAALAAHPNQPLTRDRLMSLARGHGHDAFDRSIDVMVSRLRRALEDDPRRPRWLQTVRGTGYVLVTDAAE